MPKKPSLLDIFTTRDQEAAERTVRELELENTNLRHAISKLQREIDTNAAIIQLLSKIQAGS